MPIRRALTRMLSALNRTTTIAMPGFVARGMALLLTQSRGAFGAVTMALLLYLWLLHSASILKARALHAYFLMVALEFHRASD